MQAGKMILANLRSLRWRVRWWLAKGHKRDTCWGGTSWYRPGMGAGLNEGGRWLCVVVHWRPNPFFYFSAWTRWLCPRFWVGWDTEHKRTWQGMTWRPDYAGA